MAKEDLAEAGNFLQIFSKIDLTKGYYLVPKEEADIPKMKIL